MSDNEQSEEEEENLPVHQSGHEKMHYPPPMPPYPYYYPPPPMYPYPYPPMPYPSGYPYPAPPAERKKPVAKKKPAAPSKAERKKQLAKFKEERELQAQLHKIVKIQSLIRGAIVRMHRIPHLRHTSDAVRAVAESLIENYIDEIFIPDLLLEIVTLNRMSGNFGLYSPQTQALMGICHNMVSKVVKVEVESVTRELISRFIDYYLEQRLKGQSRESFEPPHMAGADLISKVVKASIQDIIGESIEEITDQLIYYSKALMVFNSVLMPRVIQTTVKSLLNEVLSEEIYESMIENVAAEQVVLFSHQDVEEEQERLENEEKEKAFAEYIDSLILESCLAKISQEYEIEESQMLKREARFKEKRDVLAEKKRELKRDVQKDAADVAKVRDVDVKIASFNMNNDTRSIVGNNPNNDVKSIVGLEEKKVGPKSVAMSIKSVKAGSQMSLQDAVKERIAAMDKQEGGRLEPKNRLESVLMNLHS